MERRRRNRHASPHPKRAYGPQGNPDNVIPAEHPSSNDEIIIRFGDTFLNLGKMNDLDMCRLLVFIERIRHDAGYIEYLEVTDKGQLPTQNNSHIKMKKHWFITDKNIAHALGLSPRGLRKHKAEIVKRINSYLAHPSGTKVPLDQDP